MARRPGPQAGGGRSGRRWLACALLSACTSGAALAAPPTVAADAPAPVTLQAPHYGDALFAFFQDDYFGALTRLMTSQQRQRLAPHDDEAEVLRGGLLLSYGMHREAGQVFERLIERGATPSVRRRAWFFLAKLRYQRGLMAEADAALGHIDAALPPALEDERQLLQAQVAMALGRFGPAAEVLRPLAARQNELGRRPGPAAMQADGATRYARYNLGVALVRSGDTAAGQRWLDELGRAPAFDEEQLALRDQANLALGFSALQAGQAPQAGAWLERVRLNGPHAHPALLGFGWSQLGQKQPRRALVPWDELIARDGRDAASLEARLARAHALAEAGAAGAALQQYETTLAAFGTEHERLEQTRRLLGQDAWLDALLALNPDEHMGWQRAIQSLPELPDPAHLAPVLASHAFQELFKNQRDLLFLQRNLSEWLDKLGSYRDMLAHRRQVFAQRLPEARRQAGDVQLSRWQGRVDALGQALARADTQADGVAFADERQRALLDRVARVQSTLQRAGSATPELAAAQERARLLAGLLGWELAEQSADRQWQTRKALQRGQTELDQARQRLAELAQAEREQNERFAALEQRLDALGVQLRALAPQLEAQRQAQQRALQSLATAVLTQQQVRLAGYASQARFAIAQLHDRALSEPDTQESAHAPTR